MGRGARNFPHRLFGIRADGGVIFSLVSLAVTFYVFVFFWMFGIDAGR